MEPVAVLFNPSSGRGKSKRKKGQIEAKFKQYAIPYKWFASRNEAHLKELAQTAAQSFPIIIAVGGDTTFQLIASEVLSSDTDPALAMAATGSENDIACVLGWSELDSLCEAIRAGRDRRMDVGLLEIIGGSAKVYFIGALSLGLGVEVNRFVAGFWRRFPLAAKGGNFIQNMAGILGIKDSFKYNRVPLRVKLKCERFEREMDFSLMVFANIPSYAGGIELTPGVTAFDGKIDCCVISSDNFLQTLLIGLRARKGRHISSNNVEIISDTAFEIISPYNIDLQYDGETIHSVKAFKVSILTAALKVLV
jgi:diacylglycerol kinase family enzyme